MVRRIGAFVFVALVATACTNGAEDIGLSLPPPDGGVTVSEAIAGTVDSGWIRGFIVAVRDEPVRLCEALAESFPPQCAGPSLVMRDGVLWREPYRDPNATDQMTPGGAVEGGVLTAGEPCRYDAGGPCSALLGVNTANDVWWTEVEYSVIGTVDGQELRELEAAPGADL